MRGQILRGTLLGLVEGPAILLEVDGEERKLKVSIDLDLSWVQGHVEDTVTVMVTDDAVVDVS